MTKTILHENIQQVLDDTGRDRLLIVDDNAANISVLSDLFQAVGYRVLVARDGHKALARAKLTRPNLILLDVMMPGLNGFEVCKRLKADPDTTDIPVVFMTALTSEIDKVQGFEAGATDYITKPIQDAEILARVETHMRVARLTRELKELNTHLDNIVQERTQLLQQALSELEERNRQKNDSLIESANELQFPLAVLQKHYSTLQQESGGHSETVSQLGKSIEIIAEIIQSMVNLARLDADSPVGTHQSTSLQQLFDKLYFLYEPILLQRNLKYSAQLEQLPMIDVDPVQLSTALENILINAIAYTPDGGKIEISGTSDGENVLVAIRDTGIGVATEDHERIFDRYYRGGLRASSRAQTRTDFLGGGAGLGLVIAREVINKHHGRIWVESPGREMKSFPGSIFYVSLPLEH